MDALTRRMEECWREVGVAREEASGQAARCLHEARQVAALEARVDALDRAGPKSSRAEAEELRAALDVLAAELHGEGGEPPLLGRLAASEAAISRQEMHVAAVLAAPSPPSGALSELGVRHEELRVQVATVADQLAAMQAAVEEDAAAMTRVAASVQAVEARCTAAEREVQAGDVDALRGCVGALQRDVEAQLAPLTQLRAEAGASRRESAVRAETQVEELHRLDEKLAELAAALPTLQRQLQAISDSGNAAWQVLVDQPPPPLQLQQPPQPPALPSEQPLPKAHPQPPWLSPDKAAGSRKTHDLASPLSAATALAATLLTPKAEPHDSL